MAGDSVGSLTFDIGVNDRAISDMLASLERVRKAAQAALDVKSVSGLDTTLKNTAEGAGAVSRALTDSQRAVKTYTGEVRALIAEEKAGIKSKEDTARNLRELTTELGKQFTQLDKTSKEHRELATAMTTAGTAAKRLETEQKRVQAAFNADSVRRYRDAISNLRTAYEAGDKSREDFIADTIQLDREMRELRAEFSNSSREYAGFTRAIGTGQRGIQTAIGNLSRLGLSQQVLVGTTNALNLSLGGLGPAGTRGAVGITATSTASASAVRTMTALNTASAATQARFVGLAASFAPLLGLAGFVGLGRGLNSFVAEADRARVSALILEETLEGTGQNAETANQAFARAADTLGLSTAQVTDAATQLTRYGLTAEQIEKVLVAGGASALAFGKSAAAGVEAVAGAIVTENSALLSSIGIAENIGAAMAEAGRAAEGQGEEAVKAAKANAGLNIILNATGQEVESLTTLLDSNAGTVSDVNRRFYDLRVAIGTFLTPSFVGAKEAAVELFDVLLEQNAFTGSNDQAIALAETVIDLVGSIGQFTIEAAGFGRQVAGTFAGLNESVRVFADNFTGTQESIRLGWEAFQALMRGNVKEYIRLSEESSKADPFNVDNLEDVYIAYNDAYTAIAGGGMAAVDEATANLNARLQTLKDNLGETTVQTNAAGGALAGAGEGGDKGAEGVKKFGDEVEVANPKVSASVDLLAGLRAEIRGNRDEFAQGQEDVALWGEAYANSGAAINYAFDQIDNLSGLNALAAEETARQAEAQRQLNLEMLEGADTGGQYTRALIVNSQEFKNLYDSSQDARESFDLMAGGARLLGDEFENLATVTDEVALPIPEVTAEFEDYVKAFADELPKALKESADMAALFGENFNPVEAQAEAVRTEIESLIERGLEPNDEAVQDLSEQYLVLQGILKDQAEANENYRTNLEDVTSAQEALADAGGIATEDIDELIRSLDGAAQGTGLLGEQARDAQAELESLKVARDIGFLFSELGELAGSALTAIPNLSDEATGALGALQGGGQAAAAALQDGFNGVGDVMSIVGGALDGIEQALGDDLPAEARIGFDAVEGALGGAAAGAVFGPWGAVVGGVLGGIQGLFTGIAEEQQRITEEQKAFNDQLRETDDLIRDVKEANEEGLEQSESDVLGSKIEYAEESGDYKGKRGKGQLAFAQLQADLIEANETYEAAIADLDRRRVTLLNEANSITDQLISGYDKNGKRLTEADKTRLRERQRAIGTELANMQEEYDNYQEAYGYEVATLLEQTDKIAKQMGLSQQELYEALFSGNSEILGQLSGEQLNDLKQGIIAYYKVFGEFPPGAEEAAAQLGLSTDMLARELNTSDTSLAAATANGATATRQAVATYNQGLVDLLGPEAAEPIRQAILAAYNKQVAALDTGTTTFTAQVGTSKIALSDGIQGVFSSTKDALTVNAPGATSALQDAFERLKGITTTESGLLTNAFAIQGGTLRDRLTDFFELQRGTTGEEAELARLKLAYELERIRKEFEASISGEQGFTRTIGRGETGVASALEGFFSNQRTTIGTQAGATVTRIDSAAQDIREAMGRLVAASSVGRGGGIAGGAARVGGGGGGGPVGYFAPLSSFVADRTLGGFADEFGSFQTRASSIISDIEGAGSSFGYGTSFSAVRPVGDNYSGSRNAGPLSGLLKSVREGVEVYKEGIISSVNSASETTTRGFQALGYNFRKGIEEESRRNRAKVKEQARTTKELREEFIAAFDLVGGSTLLKKIGGPRSGLYDFALEIGKSIEQGFKSGVEGGAKAFLEGTGSMLETLQRDAFDQLAFGTIQKLLNSGLVEKLLGGVYTDFAAALAGGDTNNAIAKFQKVIAKLPSVAGQLEAILAPIKGIGASLGYGAQVPEPENIAQGIRLEARSLGSATPDWALKFTQSVDLFSRGADISFKASEKFAAAVARFEKGNGKLEARKPNKLTKF